MGKPGRPKKEADVEYEGLPPREEASSPKLIFLRKTPQWVHTRLEKLRGKRVIITFHSLGDLDACCSALALAEELGTQAVVAPPDRTNSESRRLLGNALKGLPLFAEAKKKYPDAPVVLLDANDPSILPQFVGGKENPLLLIDHHATQKDSIKADTPWIDPDASSTCEMVAHFITQPSPQQAEWLVLGILSDSARLVRADGETFASLSRLLLHAGRRYEELLASLEAPEPAASRTAVLEGLRQVNWAEQKGWVIATAAVSSHESHVAEVLLRAGADVAFVGTAGKSGDARISARLRPAISSQIDLPALMRQIGQQLGGSGGGHAAAAGATGPAGQKLNEALMACQQAFFRQISGK